MTAPTLSSGAERRDARADEMVYHPERRSGSDRRVATYRKAVQERLLLLRAWSAYKPLVHESFGPYETATRDLILALRREAGAAEACWCCRDGECNDGCRCKRLQGEGPMSARIDRAAVLDLWNRFSTSTMTFLEFDQALRALPTAEAGEVDVEAAERYVNGRYVRGAKAEQLFSVRSIIEYALSRPAWQAASGGRDYVAARVAGALKNKHGRVVSDLATDDPDVVVRAIVDAALSSRGTWTEGVRRIAAERQRQIDAEGYGAAHDDTHIGGEINLAASQYLGRAFWQVITNDDSQWDERQEWPWEPGAWNPSPDPIRNLEKAGALIAAEIDRLLRALAGPKGE